MSLGRLQREVVSGESAPWPRFKQAAGERAILPQTHCSSPGLAAAGGDGHRRIRDKAEEERATQGQPEQCELSKNGPDCVRPKDQL